ncbi:MAG: hypothetical protein ACKKMV_01540 [Candidatus Nealsonbacteria bacterium]
MNKKLIFLIGAVFVIGITFFFFLRYSKEIKIPRFTGDERIDKIFFDSAQDLTELYGPLELNENSLINLVHIVKKDSDYEISCQFGPSYETANLYELFPEEPVSMGQIRECNVETAIAIDEAIRSSEMDCRVFLESFPLFLNDYYLLTLAIGEREITPEWIVFNQEIKCLEPFKNFVGETVGKFVTMIIDLNENVIYY